MDGIGNLGASAYAQSGFSSTEAKPKGSASLAAVVSAFVPTWATGLVFVAIFILIRHKCQKIYAPRTFIGNIPEKYRTPAPTHAYFDWVHTMRKLSDKFVLYHHSLDTYLYLRFLRTIIFICITGCVLTWPILMLVNATGGGLSTQLDKIAIGNVKKKDHLYAHAVMAWVFLGFVMFTIARERLWLIGLRQAWTLTTSNSERLASRTVLFLSAPKDALETSNMHRYFGDGAVRIWPATEMNKLESLVADRDSLVDKLEAAEITFIKRARKESSKKKYRLQDGQTPNFDVLPNQVKENIRPRRKLKMVGEKVDSIKWLREQVKDKEAEIEQMRSSYDIGDPHGAAAVFVEFRTHVEAQRACQQVASANLLALIPRYGDVSPGDVIWKNLAIPPARRISEEGTALAIVIATIVFWSIPSGFIGLISNVSYLAENFEWLSFLRNIPDPWMGLLSGLVPPLITSLLSKLVPSIFRYIFKTFGGPTATVNELKVLKWYYVFQVTQVFLVTAVFSGAATVWSQIAKRAQDPISIPTLLAKQLPKSSNYYLTYFIIQGTTSAADNLLNYSDLLKYLFGYYFLDKTPRQKYQRFTSMKGIAWGKVFPKFANFAIIAIAYSCIAPLVLGFAAAGLCLYYVSYRYNLLYVIQPKIDTNGQAYTLALQQLLTGIYIAELALLGIFGLKRATGPSVMAGVLFLATILYHVLMNKYLSPLEKFLPADLATGAGQDDETAPLLSGAEEGRAPGTSRIQSLGQRAHVPSPVARHVVDPTARFFEPHVFASYESMKKWVKDWDYYGEDDQAPEYDEEVLRKAYLNPALTSATPIVWLARDRIGASKTEVRENQEFGLKATDQGAWLDEKGRVQWADHEFSEVPIFKAGIRY
ncbi:hypothetical protein F4780DRAFT_767960 [Xylariomycetidae sp. FL0641]|nr:hypothetical protein F4780DRAFT_767960 [Xylariomycetidae sp. FL0641]